MHHFSQGWRSILKKSHDQRKDQNHRNLPSIVCTSQAKIHLSNWNFMKKWCLLHAIILVNKHINQEWKYKMEVCVFAHAFSCSTRLATVKRPVRRRAAEVLWRTAQTSLWPPRCLSWPARYCQNLTAMPSATVETTGQLSRTVSVHLDLPPTCSVL